LIVGVDGHSKSNTAAFYLARGGEAVRPKKYTNDRKGFLELLDRVKALVTKNSLDNVIFILEPNGPYWVLLARFLSERLYTVKVVSPLQVKRNRETEDCSPDKNDYRDARSAADLGRQGKFNDLTLPEAIYEDMRSLARTREDLLEGRSAQKHRLRSELVRAFPELGTCVSDIFGKGIRALLKVVPTAEGVASLGVEEVTRILKEATRGRFGKAKAIQIVEVARTSVGYGVASKALRLRVDSILRMVEVATEEIERLEAEMRKLLLETEEGALVLSIPGIGEIGAATILGETGGLKQYRNPNQIRKLAGLDLVGRQSGDHQGEMRISKRGRKLLRKVLYQVAVASLRCNQATRRYYERLREEGRRNSLRKKEALVAVMGKMIEIVYSIVRNGKTFDPEHKWVAPGRREKQMEAVAA
jgi:transposase